MKPTVFDQIDIKRLGIILAAPVVSILIAVMVSFRSQRFILVGIVGAIGAIILFQQPIFGLIFAAGPALAIPLGLSTGSNTQVNITMLAISGVCGVWIVGLLTKKYKFHTLDQGHTKAALGLCGVAILAFLFGQMTWLSFADHAPITAQVGGVFLYIVSAGAFLATANLVTGIIQIQWMTGAFIAFGTLYILGRLMPVIGNRFLFLFHDTGSLFWLMMTCLPFALAVFTPKLNFAIRIGLLVICFSTLYIGLTAGRSWTSGWLPALCGLIAMMFFVNIKAGIGFLGAGFLVIFLALQSIQEVVMVGDNEYSLVTRLAAWDILAQIIRSNPILGVGPANYYFYTPIFTLMGYSSLRFNSHNNYVDLLAQTGILGLAIFLWFVFAIFKTAWNLKKRLQPSFVRAFSIGMIGVLIGLLVAGMLGDWVIPFVYNVGFRGFITSGCAWIFLGCIAAIDRLNDGN